LNILPEEREELMDVDVQEVVQNFGEDLIERIEVGLKDHSDFVKVRNGSHELCWWMSTIG